MFKMTTTSKLKKIPLWILLLMISMAPVLSGCGPFPENVRVVLTTGLSEEQVFRINSMICTKSEYMVYLTNLQKRYEQVYGTEIWDTRLPSSTMEEEVKESVLRELEQIKIMNLMAGRYEVNLSEEDEEKLNLAADTYYTSLSDKEAEALLVTRESIYRMYREYLISVRVHEAVMAGVDPEISDDEARIITVEQIGIKTYTTDEEGKRIEMAPQERAKVYKKARIAYERAVNGEDFGSLISEYNEVGQSRLSFGHGDKEEAYENVAFNLGQGEISQIFETEDGFFLIRCISTFNEEETAKNKEVIRERQKREAFDAEYRSYLSKVTEEVNKELWPKITFLREEYIHTDSFFKTFDTCFSGS